MVIKFKSFHVVLLVTVIGFLVFSLIWNLYENSKPMKTRIDEAISQYDEHYIRTLSIYFHKDQTYVFYEKLNNVLKVVLLTNSTFKGVLIKDVIGQIPMIQYDEDKDVLWLGHSARNTNTYCLYGVIFNPEITQLILESEGDHVAHIVRVDESRSIWFGFMDEDLNSPITIKAMDKMGKEKYYHGPYRGD